MPNSAEHEQGFYSLTVPTGGGKKLSSMAFALAHANRWDLQRVIVVIPTVHHRAKCGRYRRILDPGNKGLVVEHHSAVPVKEDDEDRPATSVQRATENWDAPVMDHICAVY